MVKLNIKDVLSIYELVIETSGGRKGVRDYDLLDSAMNSAFYTFGGVELYPSIEEKAVRIGFSLITNHAFVDGNKRTGMLVMLTLLQINGKFLKYSDDELINIGMSLASGMANYEDLLKWVNDHKIITTKPNSERSK